MRKRKIERGLVERLREGMSGCETHTVSNQHQLSRETSGYTEIMSSGVGRDGNRKQMKRENEREGSHNPSSGNLIEFQRAGKGKREERECVMHTHAFAYMCFFMYIYLLIHAGELVLVPRFSLSKASFSTTSRVINSTNFWRFHLAQQQKRVFEDF